MPSHVETPSRILGRTVGKTTFRPGLLPQDRDGLNVQLGNNNRLETLPDRILRPVRNKTLGLQRTFNVEYRTSNLRGRAEMPSTFGLQARNQATTSSQLENNFNLNREGSSMHTTVSRTFGLVPEEMDSVSNQQNEISASNVRRNDSIHSSLMPRAFGLQTRNSTLHSRFLSENDLRQNPLDSQEAMNYRRNNSNVSVVSRTFGLRSEKVVNGVGGCGNEGFVQDLRGNGSVNVSVIQRPFAQLRNSTMQSALVLEGGSRMNLESSYRNNNLSSVVNPFGAGDRGRAVGGGAIAEESGKCGEEVLDEGGFRRPTLSRVIRGRNSLLSSRLFHNQTMDRHCRDLSNINGFNVSHISRRGMDTMSESRLAFRSNWMDNQSMTGSMMSGASMKAQFMNLLENLHHSILNIGPHVTAEAVRMEFDKAKQGLESISEMSFAPSIREPDAASTISHSSKYICESVKGPAINEVATENVIDGGSFLLKSSAEVLKTLVSRKASSNKGGATSSVLPGQRGRRNAVASRESSASKDSDDEEVAEFLFKKPKPVAKRKPGRKAKAKPSEVGKSSPKGSNKAVSLKQWYPVALGSDLVFCGVNEEGINVKTEAVKKRLSGRKVELISGLICNLVGSPSLMVSALPQKISLSLANGLTERWRVLQNELLACQTTGESRQKRKSKSPRVVSSPRKSPKKAKKSPKKSPKTTTGLAKKLVLETPAPKGKPAGKSKSPKTRASPSKSGKGTEVLTRSGRTVKPPSEFWLVSRGGEMSSLLTSTTPEVTVERKHRKKTVTSAVGRTPEEVAAESAKKGAEKEGKESEAKKIKRSPGRPRKANVESQGRGKGKSPKARSPKKGRKEREEEKEKEKEEGVRVHSSTEEAKRQNKALQSRGKRKREVAGDVESVQAKKSKIEKKVEAEVESTVEDAEPMTKKPKQRKGGTGSSGYSSKSKGKKSPGRKSKKESKKKTTTREAACEGRKEEKEVNEFEEDFELKLDDIEIPEIANVSGNPQLSRSQLRVVSMETPPLKYFNNNLKLLGSATPLRSPDWCISQRTESEVKRFQKRREGALKKKAVNVKRTIVTEKTTKTVESRDVKRVMEWVAEKAVRSPVWGSKILQYVIPSRRQREQQLNDDEEEEDMETEFSKTSFT